MNSALIVGFIMIIAAAAFVAWPFFRVTWETESEGDSTEGGERAKWERQKRDAYAVIKDAEFDYRMNKLSDADFDATRSKYTALALEAITALDAAASKGRASAGRRPGRIAYCPACGRGVPPRANFCGGCGHSLREAVA